MSDSWSGVRVHPTALIEPEVQIGDGTSVWDGVHIRRQARIGRNCIIGEKTYIAYDVTIGNLVKLNANVYICAGVTIEDGVMIAAHTVFTNDRFPRAALPDFTALVTSEPTDETLTTVVRRGATIGANATVAPGIEIGEFAMIGMGSVVTRSVPAFGLAFGSPARLHGYVCSCGHPLATLDDATADGRLACSHCSEQFELAGRVLQRVGARSLA